MELCLEMATVAEERVGVVRDEKTGKKTLVMFYRVSLKALTILCTSGVFVYYCYTMYVCFFSILKAVLLFFVFNFSAIVIIIK